MNEGSFIFLDMMIQSGMSFYYDSIYCDINCFNILKDYSDADIFIAQLHIVCNGSDVNHSTKWRSISAAANLSSFVSYGSPYYVYFEYNQIYEVDSLLYLTFGITDIFDNIITNYPDDVSIQFTSRDLSIDETVIANISTIIGLKPTIRSDDPRTNFTIVPIVNDYDLISKKNISITVKAMEPEILNKTEIKTETNIKTIQNKDLLYLLFLLLPLFVVICGLLLFWRYQYMKAYIVHKSLVLIIAISTFIDGSLNLNGVKQNVIDLKQLWGNEYKYDVCICNEESLYCTKKDVIGFIDDKKEKLENTEYDSVIVHIVSHGQNDSFTTSDLKEICLDLIRHELNEISYNENKGFIKLLFHHGCRGNQDYNLGNRIDAIDSDSSNDTCLCCGCLCNCCEKEMKAEQEEKQSTIEIMSQNNVENEEKEKYRTETRWSRSAFGLTFINNTDNNAISGEANCLTIYGNVSGRVMTDSGNFTGCICSSFKDNLSRRIKADWNSLIVEIGRNLEIESNKAEICTVSGTLRYNPIRFEKNKK